MPIKFILSDYKCGKIRGTPQNLLSAGIKLNICYDTIYDMGKPLSKWGRAVFPQFMKGKVRC